jgi:hypothetical protein
MCQTEYESNNSIDNSDMKMICMECNIKLNPSSISGKTNIYEPEYKKSHRLSKDSSILDMTINQSYDDISSNSSDSNEDQSITIQKPIFENSDHIQRKELSSSMGYDDKYCKFNNKLDHSIEFDDLEDTSSKIDASGSDLDSLTNDESVLCSSHGQPCFMRCDNMLSKETKCQRFLCQQCWDYSFEYETLVASVTDVYCSSCIDKLRGLKPKSANLSTKLYQNSLCLDSMGKKVTKFKSLNRYKASLQNNTDVTNTKTVSALGNSNDLFCHSKELPEVNHRIIDSTPKGRAICPKHKSTALFTCENDHYMGTNMKCIGKVCKFCIPVSKDIKELLPCPNNVFCAACIQEITTTPSIQNVKLSNRRQSLTITGPGSESKPIELDFSCSDGSTDGSVSKVTYKYSINDDSNASTTSKSLSLDESISSDESTSTADVNTNITHQVCYPDFYMACMRARNNL